MVCFSLECKGHVDGQEGQEVSKVNWGQSIMDVHVRLKTVDFRG